MPWNVLAFLLLSFLLSLKMCHQHCTVCIKPLHISDEDNVTYHQNVLTAVWKSSWKPFATLERNLVQPCVEIPLIWNLEQTHAAAGDWEVGFWVSGVQDSTRIFLWKHNQIELLLCVSYISCVKKLCSTDLISVSAASVLYRMRFK